MADISRRDKPRAHWRTRGGKQVSILTRNFTPGHDSLHAHAIMHSDTEDDEDIEEIIKQELAALDNTEPEPEPTNDLHDEDNSRRDTSSTSWPMLNASPSVVLHAEDEYGLEVGYWVCRGDPVFSCIFQLIIEMTFRG